MGVIFALLVFVGLAAIIVWVADWTSVGVRPTAVDILNRRLARGEIDRAEYEGEACVAALLAWNRPQVPATNLYHKPSIVSVPGLGCF
jgi:hypothetical protein